MVQIQGSDFVPLHSLIFLSAARCFCLPRWCCLSRVGGYREWMYGSLPVQCMLGGDLVRWCICLSAGHSVAEPVSRLQAGTTPQNRVSSKWHKAECMLGYFCSSSWNELRIVSFISGDKSVFFLSTSNADFWWLAQHWISFVAHSGKSSLLILLGGWGDERFVGYVCQWADV